MLSGCTYNQELETLGWGIFRLYKRSCGTKVPLLTPGCIEHVNNMGDRITVLRPYRATSLVSYT